MARTYTVYVEGTDEAINVRPLSFTKAKQLARIGSQHGASREVVRGCCGIVVRVYADGERVFPLDAADAVGLTAAELPREIF